MDVVYCRIQYTGISQLDTKWKETRVPYLPLTVREDEIPLSFMLLLLPQRNPFAILCTPAIETLLRGLAPSHGRGHLSCFAILAAEDFL